MQIITSDYIPVRPFFAETLLLAIGQRYDVIINANQSAGSYWFRASVADDCLSLNKRNALAIWTYSGVKRRTPKSSSYKFPSSCVEPSSLVPYWVQTVPSSDFASSLRELDVTITGQRITPNGSAIFVWALGNSSLNLDWEYPTLSYLMDGNTSYPDALNVIPTVTEGRWNFWLVQQPAGLAPIPHPIHLHGHDVFVLGQGSGSFDVNTAELNFATAPRRDTASVQAGGWLALAFNSNNPGKLLVRRVLFKQG